MREKWRRFRAKFAIRFYQIETFFLHLFAYIGDVPATLKISTNSQTTKL